MTQVGKLVVVTDGGNKGARGMVDALLGGGALVQIARTDAVGLIRVPAECVSVDSCQNLTRSESVNVQQSAGLSWLDMGTRVAAARA